MKKILISCFLVFNVGYCFAYFEDFKKVIRLTNIKIDQNGYGVQKSYSYDDPLIVKYSYGENFSDGEWVNKLHLGLEESSGEILVPVDVAKVGFSVGGDHDEVTKLFKIPDIDLPENCNLVGTASVRLKDMLIWVPEYPAGYASSAKVVKVLFVSKPRLDCSENISED